MRLFVYRLPLSREKQQKIMQGRKGANDRILADCSYSLLLVRSTSSCTSLTLARAGRGGNYIATIVPS